MLLRLHFVFLAFTILFYCRIRVTFCIPSLNGIYTAEIESYQLSVPQKMTVRGQFLSFELPHFFRHDRRRGRRRRSPDDPHMVHYGVYIGGEKRHLELWPNHGLVSPSAVFEKREPPTTRVDGRHIGTLNGKKLCHYTGTVRGHDRSKVAISTCNGLAGYVNFNGSRYYIEPLDEHAPNSKGQLLHVVYDKGIEGGRDGKRSLKNCGTREKWESSWKRRFKEKYEADEQDDEHVANQNYTKRGASSVHRYLETLIVCDKRFMEHHRNRDYETYVLTIMNMVYDFYQDFTSGHQMDVTVVRIMYLEKEEEEIDLVINHNADATLASFCTWQVKVNPSDVKNANHHDIAVLLTRHDICGEEGTECGLMGLAYVATACEADKSCAINEDGGLVLGIVVAHEMGHVMGCSHDTPGESDCPSNDTDGSYFIMAPYVHLFTTRWSVCSKTFMTALFENDLGECLNDEPENSIYKAREILPGTVYDADAQCDMLFPGSKRCDIPVENFCEALYCRTDPNECMGDESPPADGTKCAENKWCFKKKCIEMGERPAAVSGGWGEWKEYTQCSRTCGGGVMVSERECDNPRPQNHGLYCMGERKRFKTCNTQACPDGAPNFREVQCAAHNDKPYKGKLYAWKAYLVKDEPCVLNCLNSDNTYAKLEPRCKDGTMCKAGTKNMCVSGVCMKVGCDYVINSGAIEDVCGICKGDGSRCKIVEEVYKDPPGVDYKKVTTLPKGARNVEVEELSPTVNTLAVSDKDGAKFFLNGNFTERTDGDVKLSEVEGLYTHPEPGKERLFVHGPLDQDMILFVVFYKAENVGVRYKYADPTSESSTKMASYHWEVLDFTDCDAKCGGGVQASVPSCVESQAGRVSDSFCADVAKPEGVTKKCNEQPCKARWQVGRWSECHACKYKSGVRTREVDCVQESPRPGAEDVLVDDEECGGAKPGTRELCNSHKKCKSRRQVEELPGHMMEAVWFQTVPYSPIDEQKDVAKRQSVKSYPELSVRTINAIKSGRKNDVCDEEKTQHVPKDRMHVGTIVTDKEPKSEVKLVRLPVKQEKAQVNISDESFELMGDQVSSSVDFSKASAVKGEEAIKVFKKMEEKGERLRQKEDEILQHKRPPAPQNSKISNRECTDEYVVGVVKGLERTTTTEETTSGNKTTDDFPCNVFPKHSTSVSLVDEEMHSNKPSRDSYESTVPVFPARNWWETFSPSGIAPRGEIFPNVEALKPSRSNLYGYKRKHVHELDGITTHVGTTARASRTTSCEEEPDTLDEAVNEEMSLEVKDILNRINYKFQKTLYTSAYVTVGGLTVATSGPEEEDYEIERNVEDLDAQYHAQADAPEGAH